MAITESDAERQARIEADIRRLFARYRRAPASNGDGSEQTADNEPSVRGSSAGRFGSHTRPVKGAPPDRPPRAR
jgi:hypothetical protein